MKIPIFNTLYNATNKTISSRLINFKKLNNLELKLISSKKFPSIRILNQLPEMTSLFETILVTLNDELVKRFLNKKIEFNQITPKIMKLLKTKEFQKYKSKTE